MRLLVILLALVACTRPALKTPAVASSERDAELAPTEGAIGGIVRDAADGQPLSMVSVQAERNGVPVAHDISDYTGRYRLGPLEPGRYDIRAKFAEARVEYKDITVEKSLETEVNIGIDLRAHGDTTSVVATEGARGEIQGVVLDGARGTVFPGTVVSLSADHLEDVVMAIADDRGQFLFKGLRPGVYDLSCFYTLVEQGNIEVRRSNIVVKPGESTSVELRLDLKIK